jgi:RES domain-containing protein
MRLKGMRSTDLMAQFKSWDSYGHFSREIARRRRYVRTPDAEEFLHAVASTCKTRVRTVREGHIFFRAQLGHEWQTVEDEDHRHEQEVAFSPSRMKPRKERAPEGRANPKGIPCLYLSTTRDAAMSEVRPWVGALVSVAQFKVMRPLTVVDCSVLQGRYFEHAFLNRTIDELASGKTYPPDELEKIVWAAIDTAFSEPVTDSDDVADYAATQTLAELFRSEGYDGVAYKSAFGKDGYSVALFDLDSARQLNAELYKVEGVEFKFSDNPVDQYFFKDDGTAFRTVIVSIEPVPQNK